MFVGHKRRTKEETKKMLKLSKRLDERKKKEEQDQIDAEWLTSIRRWKPETTNNSGR